MSNGDQYTTLCINQDDINNINNDYSSKNVLEFSNKNDNDDNDYDMSQNDFDFNENGIPETFDNQSNNAKNR